MTRSPAPQASPAVAAAARSRMRARTVWLKVHLYIALTLGGFIAVLALAGSVLTFHPEVDRLLTPALRTLPHEPPRITAHHAVTTVAQQLGYRPALVWMPRPDSPAYIVEGLNAQNDTFHLVAVSPADGAILADRTWGRTLVTFLFELHTSLLLGERGLAVVGCLALALLVSIVTGLYLWWPRGTWWRALLFRRVRGALPINFEMHRLAGVYASIVLLVVAATGVYLALPSQYEAVAKLFVTLSPDPEAQPVVSAPRAARAQPLTLDQVERLARSHVPGRRIASFRLPDGADDAYSVRYVDGDEPQNRNGRSTLWLDQYSGRLLKSHSYSRLGASDRFLALQLPLHDGEILGNAGRVLVCVAGLVICGLYVTGLYLWWRRRKTRA